MPKAEAEEKIAKEVPADKGRFDDLWALSDAEIEKGMETLGLDALNEEVARRRGR